MSIHKGYSALFIFVATLYHSITVSAAVPAICVDSYRETGAVPQTPACPSDAMGVDTDMGNFFCLGSQGLRWITEYCNMSDDECPEEKQDLKSTVGNPISVTNGTKIQYELDYTDHSWDNVNYPLTLARFYNSGVQAGEGIFGYGWRSNYDISLKVDSTKNVARVYRPSGNIHYFTFQNGEWVSANVKRHLTEIIENEVRTGWIYTEPNATTEHFDASGRLLSIRSSQGAVENISYVNGKLYRVTDQAGRFLEFTFNENGAVKSVLDPEQREISYEYEIVRFGADSLSVAPRLRYVKFQDDTPTNDDNPKKEYLYAETAYSDTPTTSYEHVFLLTGIVDEIGDRYASFGYDVNGRANLSVHGTNTEDGTSGDKANADRIDISYTVTSSSWSAVTTNAKNKSATYSFRTVAGARKLSSINGHPSLNCGATTSSVTYDSRGMPNLVKDQNGNSTDYDYDAEGVERRRIEALGTPEQRTIETDWNYAVRQPQEIRKPGLTIAFTYENGRVSTRTERDTTTHSVPYSTAGTTRVWTYTYTYHDSAQTQVREVRIDGPRTDVQDITTYNYDTRGWLTSRVNARNQTYVVLEYNGRGQPSRTRDENGVESTFTYYPRGWLKTRTVESREGNSTTTYHYDARGLLVGVDKPTGVSLTMDYDSAHRLTSVENNAGERVEYELDALGNIETERVIGSGNQIRKQVQVEFDEIGQLWRKFAQEGHVLYEYGYDNNGNRTSERDVNAQNLIQQFDALNRVKLVQQRNNAEIAYAYDPMGNLETVTDQRKHVSRYVYNGFGNRIYEVSPDSSATTYHYDLAGNKTQSIDARNVRTNYTYDTLNRPQTVRVEGYPANDVTYTYDETGTTSDPNFGVGRLTSVSQAAGITTEFRYDDRGNLARRSETIDGQTYITQYRYTLGNALRGLTYPSGRSLTYGFDTLARVNRITSRENASTAEQVIVDTVVYLPLGPVESLRFGNGYVLNKGFDNHYRHDTISTTYSTSALQSLDYGYRTTGTIESITDAVHSAESETFDYNNLRQLTSATGSYGQRTFDYDDAGNREIATVQSGANTWTDTYTTHPDNNRLMSVVRTGTEASTRSYGYTDDGNIQSEGNRRFVYDGLDRLSEVVEGSTTIARYKHNAFGQRVVKSLPALSDAGRHFQYDQAGQLLAEFTVNGQPRRDYVYLGGTLIAMIDQEAGNVSYTDIGVELVGNTGKFVSATKQTSYYVNVTNGSAVPANDAALTLTYPADATLVSIQPSTGACSGDGRRCELGNIAPNATVRIDVTVGLPAKGKRDFTASAETSTSEAATSNNSATNKFGGSLGIAGLAALLLLTLRRRAASLKSGLTNAYSSYLRTGLVAIISALYAVIAPTVSAEQIYYVHTDHLNTPKVVTNQAREVVWRGRYSPFGEVEEVVSQIENNVRFPGQYFDSETGLHYNMRRDYDPSLGRYVEADPIGIIGGLNLYGYAEMNPISMFDEKGLSPCTQKCDQFLFVCGILGSIGTATCAFACGPICLPLLGAAPVCTYACGMVCTSAGAGMAYGCKLAFDSCMANCGSDKCQPTPKPTPSPGSSPESP